MEIYLVGGAVRDELLGREVRERDWLVVGGSAKTLLAQGYRQVGKDFPVFLHPDTHEEYALARTERKSAAGHTGFTTDANPQVTLEEDLARRDLTINALAKDRRGRVIDPFGGRKDSERRLLRHVTEAFAEDPLRVFRVARFAAQLEGFSVHADTRDFMAGMAGTLTELPAERVWGEFRKALAAPSPQRFIEVLKDCGCLSLWFPELEDIHLDDGLGNAEARYGAIGWSLAPAPMQALSKRLKTPNAFARLADDIARHGRLLSDWRGADVEELLAALIAINGFRDPDRRRAALAVAGFKAGVNLNDLDEALVRIENDLAAERPRWPKLSGPEIGAHLRKARLDRLAKAQGLGPYSPPGPQSLRR